MSRFALLLDYSFSAVLKNWKAVVLFFLILILLFFFHFFPFLSFVGQVIVSFIVTQIEVYYGRAFMRAGSREELLEFLKNSPVSKIFTENIQVSSGIFFASFIVTTALSLFTFGLLFVTGLIYDFNSVESVENALVYGLIYFLIISTVWLTYFYLVPLGIGYGMSRESFGEAFLGFFRIFTPSFWKKAMSFQYFKLITLGGILLTVFAVLGFVFTITLILSPLGAAVFYLTAVFWGSLCAESYRVSFLQSDNGAGVN